MDMEYLSSYLDIMYAHCMELMVDVIGYELFAASGLCNDRTKVERR